MSPRSTVGWSAGSKSFRRTAACACSTISGSSPPGWAGSSARASSVTRLPTRASSARTDWNGRPSRTRRASTRGWAGAAWEPRSDPGAHASGHGSGAFGTVGSVLMDEWLPLVRRLLHLGRIGSRHRRSARRVRGRPVDVRGGQVRGAVRDGHAGRVRQRRRADRHPGPGRRLRRVQTALRVRRRPPRGGRAALRAPRPSCCSGLRPPRTTDEHPPYEVVGPGSATPLLST